MQVWGSVIVAQENDGSCVVRLRNYCDAKWLVEQAGAGSVGVYEQPKGLWV